MKKILRYCIIAGIAALVLSGVVFARSLQPIEGSDERQTFVVRAGESLADIARRLQNEGLVRSAASFRWYSLFAGSAHTVKPGAYRISSSESAVRIAEKLAKGPEDVTVVIPEGATLRDIARLLAANGILQEGAVEQLPPAGFSEQYPFLKNRKSLEGFLFPDTYKFAPQSEATVVVKKMLDNFAAKAYPLLRAAGSALYETLIIASLVEKEVPDVADDRAIVSGIILRRLRIGMGLQIDATVLYAKCASALFTCASPRLAREDYAIASPYNTYAHAGLPPTPIANPGIDAIRAAINPKETDYLFYLSDPKTKRTIFSKDFEEHNEQRAKYLGL
ncbi:MAG: endolytic transglycosylase MltG [Candidatus Harrisonbacteria bacterium]|nr:endolytic transglycosylase MltG [Candidatus Harrisonbacteria bacterium]